MTAPTPFALALADTSNGGSLLDDLTNDTTVTITGMGVPTDVVTLYDGQNPTAIGTASIGSDGTWSITTGSLSDGSHSLVATETTSDEMVSPPSSPLDVTIDSSVPGAPSDLALDPQSDSGAPGDGRTTVTTPFI